jgi:hypothetical protein
MGAAVGFRAERGAHRVAAVGFRAERVAHLRALGVNPVEPVRGAWALALRRI